MSNSTSVRSSSLRSLDWRKVIAITISMVLVICSQGSIRCEAMPFQDTPSMLQALETEEPETELSEDPLSLLIEELSTVPSTIVTTPITTETIPVTTVTTTVTTVTTTVTTVATTEEKEEETEYESESIEQYAEDEYDDEVNQYDSASENYEEEIDTEAEEQSEFCTDNLTSCVSDDDYILLCNVVGHEYGSDWVDVYEKAKVVEVVMNRLYSSAWAGNTIFEIISAPGQFSGYSSYAYLGDYSGDVSQSVKDAVNYYFAHPEEYQHGYTKFSGDGTWNYFS